jgi:hypothetical protein
MIMSDISKKYIKNLNHIYDSTLDLQKITKEKVKNFGIITNFRDYVIGNAEIINQFKNISSDICQIIDNKNFVISGISSKFDQIKIVNQRANQVKTKVKETKRFFSNEQITEFEKLIKSCFNNLTFCTIDDYETKLVDVNRQLLEFIDQIRPVECLISQAKNNISENKHLFTNVQIAEFEKFIKDFNNLTLGAIDNYKIKLAQLPIFIDQIKLMSQVKDKINETKLLGNKHQNEVVEFERLIEDCFNDMALGMISKFNNKLKSAYMRLLYLVDEEPRERRAKEKKEKEEQRRIEQSNRWQAQGLSRCCGAKFKGFFSKECTSCGIAKNY